MAIAFSCFTTMFLNREDAGRQLARCLLAAKIIKYRNPVIIVLPRGGVPVGLYVARALNVPLEVFVVKKIGAPGNPEYGIGAAAEDGTYDIDYQVAASLDLSPDELKQAVQQKVREAKKQAGFYRKQRNLSVQGRDVIVVDDGLATGSAARVAALALRTKKVNTLILAIPVAAADSLKDIKRFFDDVVSVESYQNFGAVGFWYEEFNQVTDKEVFDALNEAAAKEQKKVAA